MCAWSLNCVWLFATPWSVAHRLLCPWDSPGKNTGVGSHSLLQGNLPDLGIEPGSPASQVDSLWLSHQGVFLECSLKYNVREREAGFTLLQSQNLRTCGRKHKWEGAIMVPQASTCERSSVCLLCLYRSCLLQDAQVLSVSYFVGKMHDYSLPHLPN